MNESDDRFFEKLAESEPVRAMPAPARLKSRVYSALLRRQGESGPLASLSDTKIAGRGLCVFEQVVEMSPAPTALQCMNYCHICHARILAERMEHAPIYWSHCPYVRFQNR